MKTKIFIAFIALGFLISCSSKQNEGVESEVHEEHDNEGVVTLNEKQQEALNLKLGNFQMRNLTTVVKTNGQLEVPPSGIAEITAIIGGNVKEIKVFQGDKVYKGQVLAILEHPDYITLQEEFSRIANELEYLEKEYNRQKELFENNVGAGKDFQKVKSEFNTAKARFEGLRSRLKLVNISPEKVAEGHITNYVSIFSPIGGYVNEVNINVGRYVDAKDKMFEITDVNTIHADFMIYEKDVHLIKEGQTIHFTVSNRPDEELTARIFAIADIFDALTSKRPYKEPISFDDTMTILAEGRDAHFDPSLLDTFNTIAKSLYQKVANASDTALREMLESITRQYFSKKMYGP